MDGLFGCILLICLIIFLRRVHKLTKDVHRLLILMIQDKEMLFFEKKSSLYKELYKDLYTDLHETLKK